MSINGIGAWVDNISPNAGVADELQQVIAKMTLTRVAVECSRWSLHRADVFTVFQGASVFQGAAILGIGSFGIGGIRRFFRGIGIRNLTQAISGAFQTIAGVAGCVAAAGMHGGVIEIIHNGALLSAPGFFMVKLGLYNLGKREYLKGACGVFIGVGQMASIVSYVWDACQSAQYLSEPLRTPQDIKYFMDAHQQEVEKMYGDEKAEEGWTLMGAGSSKAAFVHPELAEMVVKIPGRELPGVDAARALGDLKLHVRGAGMARNLVASLGFDRILIPKTFVYPLSHDRIAVIEERFNCTQFSDYVGDSRLDTPSHQFNLLKYTIGLCDVTPHQNHNACLVVRENNVFFGLFDFDCIDTGSLTISSNWGIERFQRGMIKMGRGLMVFGAMAEATRQMKGGVRRGSVLLQTAAALGLGYALMTSPKEADPAGALFVACGVGAVGGGMMGAAALQRGVAQVSSFFRARFGSSIRAAFAPVKPFWECLWEHSKGHIKKS